MYFIYKPNTRRGLGLAEPQDTSDRARSLEAIKKALDLNPAGGYVKGSSARRKLEDAIKSVPVTSALEIFNQLRNGVGTLGKLFQYRLHDATKRTMLDILWLKHLEQQKQLKDAQEILKRACEEQKQAIEKFRVAVRTMEDSVEQICKTTGEDSDACQKSRFTLLEAKTRLEDTIRTHGTRCP
ncbi:MAG TPA: hypothetical protein VF088_22195 [Pyrinomonadaceae bacterium]